jgi:hypothetical protein
VSREFIEALRALRRKRITLEEMRGRWLELHPEQLQHPERDALLLAALKEHAEAGTLSLPAAASYELHGNPRMPKFITLLNDRPRPPPEDWASVPWLPELGFWTTLTESELHTAKAINAWLLRRRGRFLQVPLRERSLEIFDDEKYLDARVRGDTLFAGRLSLATLGAFIVPNPLPYRAAAAPGSPILIVENHHTYWSLAEWNIQTRRYAAVVYSSGNVLANSVAALEEVMRESGGAAAKYFGDLDPRGVLIPLGFNEGSRIQLMPAVDLYRMSLAIGLRRPSVNRIANDEAAAQKWIPECAAELVALWNAGRRIPQESIGTEQLFREKLAALR